MKIFALLSLVFVFFVMSCAPRKFASEGEKGTLKKLELDGCSWIIELENGDRLQPINLESMNFELNNNKKVTISYEAVDAISICMSGKTVELKWIR
jgi:hypothetical protein